MSSFKTHRLTEAGLKQAERIGAAFTALERELKEICPPSRELSIAMTQLETACFFAKRSIAEQYSQTKLPIPTFVNGKAFLSAKASATYEELAEVAGYDPAHTPTILALAGGGRAGKCLVRGESVELVEGMHISVTMTTNA